MHDIKDLVSKAEAAGFTVRRTRRGHYQFKDGEGQVVAVCAGTPSDWRGIKNTVARLRAAGVRIPHRNH